MSADGRLTAETCDRVSNSALGMEGVLRQLFCLKALNLSLSHRRSVGLPSGGQQT